MMPATEVFPTGRGCPYDCSYCFNHAWADTYENDGRRVRRRSVDLVLDEIVQVRERWLLGSVVFLDDTFILQKPWLAEFAEKYSHQKRIHPVKWTWREYLAMVRKFVKLE